MKSIDGVNYPFSPSHFMGSSLADYLIPCRIDEHCIGTLTHQNRLPVALHDDWIGCTRLPEAMPR